MTQVFIKFSIKDIAFAEKNGSLDQIITLRIQKNIIE
jgi:hypothetical protein